MIETTARLRELIGGSQMLLAPFVYDCLQAKLAERTGFDAVYMTGFGTAAARGFPDLGLITMPEMVANVRAIITKLRSRRASHAARTFGTICSIVITCLPCRNPQRFGHT